MEIKNYIANKVSMNQKRKTVKKVLKKPSSAKVKKSGDSFGAKTKTKKNGIASLAEKKLGRSIVLKRSFKRFLGGKK